jgi:hypothetical protein
MSVQCVSFDRGRNYFSLFEFRICFGLRLSGFGISRRHGIMPTRTPGLTSANSLQRQPTSRQRAVNAQSLDRKCRTGWLETAASQRSKYDSQNRRHQPLIELHTRNHYMLCWIHLLTRSIFRLSLPLPSVLTFYCFNVSMSLSTIPISGALSKNPSPRRRKPFRQSKAARREPNRGVGPVHFGGAENFPA